MFTQTQTRVRQTILTKGFWVIRSSVLTLFTHIADKLSIFLGQNNLWRVGHGLVLDLIDVLPVVFLQDTMKIHQTPDVFVIFIMWEQRTSFRGSSFLWLW